MTDMISRDDDMIRRGDAVRTTRQASWTGIRDETERLIRALPAVQPDFTDPNVVHANMLRGTIAKPTVDQIRHIYGDDLPDAAAIREAALREVLEALAAKVDQMRQIRRKANNANKMRRELEADGAFEILAVLAGMIDNTGKETK